MTTRRPRAGAGRGGRKERAVRVAIGMPARHPGLVARKPGRAERKNFGAWLAELWPHNGYTASVTEVGRQNRP
jgi:hypothetical protein